MLGGGTWISQNKKLPGSYVNVVSVAKASATLADRGIATMPISLDWGIEQQVFKVTTIDLLKDARKLFGYEYGSEKLKGIRDLFLNIKECYFYRLNKGTKASNAMAEAVHGGIRGNDLKIVVKKNIDDTAKFDVSTLLGTETVDLQTVATASELVANDWVTFKSTTLQETASTPLTGGTNGSAITSADYMSYLGAIESYSFNAMGIPIFDSDIARLAIAFAKRMRDEVGAKFQVVVYRQNDADYEGVVSVENDVLNDENKASMVYFTTGIIAGCEINKSNTNRKYNGEFTVNANYTQTELAVALEEGKFVYHKVADEIRVLEDINTFVSFTLDKGNDFANNQTIRIADQIANDIAILFNDKYLGKVPNNATGRIALWNDIVKHHIELERLQAIENFSPESLVVEPGEDKRSVLVSDQVNVVNAMRALYMTVYVA